MRDGEGLRFRLLGGVAASRGGDEIGLGGPKPRALLGLLLLTPGRVVPLDRIVEVVWSGRPPAQAEVSVRGYVSKLRRALDGPGPGSEAETVLPWRDGGYLLLVAAEQVDLHRFEAADLGAAADAEWDGAPFGGLADVLDPDGTVTARVANRRAEATETRLRLRVARGEHQAALVELAAAVAADPLREGVQALHALALYRAGRPVEALRAIEAARRALAEEVGVDPGPELRELEAQVLAHDPALRWVDDATSSRDRGAAPVAPFVGRTADRDRLAAALASGGTAVVVGGPAGIGKSALVRHVLADLGPDVAVGWGRAVEAAPVPFGPWRAVARDLAGHGVALPLPAGAPDADQDPAGVRQRTHDDVVDALRRADPGTVVVLDDLQWADEASLALTAHVAGALDTLPVTVVATVRDPAPGAPAFAAAREELARVPGAVALALGSLAPAEVAEWTTLALGDRSTPGLAEAVAARTGGHALFVREVLALAASTAADDLAAVVGAVPPAVGDLVRRRTSGLAPEAQRVLSVASVAGRVIDVGVLASVVGSTEDDVLDVLEAAVDAGLVAADPATGGLGFTHALVVDALADEVNAVRRARVHAAMAAALVARPGALVGDGLVTAAHHAWAGSTAGAAALAADLCRRAGRQALVDGAPADAVVQLERAVGAIVRDGRPPSGLLVELGRARTAAGDIDGGRSALVEAPEAAEPVDDVDGLTAALSEVNADDLWSSLDWGQHDPRVLAVAERTLDRLPPTAASARAALLAATASQLYHVDVHRSEVLSAEAVAVAEEADDPLLLARVLVQRYWCTWRPSGHAARTAVADRLLALVAEGGLPPWFTPLAHLARFTTGYEEGDAATVEHHLVRARAAADPRRTPSADSYVRYAEASVLLLRGDRDRAAAAIAEVHEAFRRTRAVTADGTAAGMTMVLHLLARETAAALEVSRLFDGSPFEASARWFRAWILAEAGRAEEAVAELERFDGALADDWYRLPLLTAGLHAAGLAGSRAQVERLLPAARPLAGFLACTGSGGIVAGPVDLALARAEHVRGDDGAARRHLAAGTAMALRLGATPWIERAEGLRVELDAG